MDHAEYDLAHRFTADSGVAFLSGLQALARIPIEQMRLDRRGGLSTATFVSGYPGSPLGGFDGTMRNAAALVPDLPIECRPAINEEYAATAIMGSQLAATLPDCRYDGVVGIWYGKSPGVDRAADALRHAVYTGTARAGGAVAFVGDDPSAKSSTLPSSSAGLLSDLHMPMLYPADPAEVLELGRHAIALVTRERIVDGDEDRRRRRRRHRVGRARPGTNTSGDPGDRRARAASTTRRPAADATEPRPRTRDLRGPLPARDGLRRRESTQPHHRRPTRRMDRHRRVRHHLSGAAGGVPPARTRPTSSRSRRWGSDCSSSSSHCRSIPPPSASSRAASRSCSSSRRSSPTSSSS